MKAPLIGINRHRLATDGVGVTTLVAFHGCPLQCRYCLNPRCLQADGIWRTITPEELYGEVEIDDIYFVATGGGICFGGGEPLLYADFIEAFFRLMNPEWKLAIETSLNVPLSFLRRVSALVETFIIDVKDMNEDIYKAYTGIANCRVIDNLKWMVANNMADRCIIRLPLIPSYNSDEDRNASEAVLKDMGFKYFDRFNYVKSTFVL
ncbi:radical SAM protein [Prevotella sp. HUN102]|uniref:radical SAM protein n=1 Tax=Prevotella sp. HUN102 TaxID=1392486 RepID=UPI000491D4B0|nr:radical SAM protein [Prevotella sp. HUN102]